MLILTCSSAAVPCPVADQVWLDLAAVVSPAAAGFTVDGFQRVFTWGFGAVLMFFLIGYATAGVLGMIRRV